MKSIRCISFIFGAFLLVSLIIGCSSSGSNMMNNSSTLSGQSLTLQVTPPNGTTGVRTDAAIGIKFNAPMDTLSLMSRFFLTGGTSMQMWMDSMNHSGGGGHESHHSDPNRMYVLMDSLQIHGRFVWNATRDSCSFVPDSLMSGTTHMILMDGGMMSSDGMIMEMDKNGASNSMSFHFTTAP